MNLVWQTCELSRRHSTELWSLVQKRTPPCDYLPYAVDVAL